MTRGRIDESERVFALSERRIAEVYVQEGHLVRALREGAGAGRCADAEVDGIRHEFKSLDVGATSATVRNCVNNSIRRAGQARHITIDARDSGLSLAEAQRGLARIQGIARGRVDMVRIIGESFDITSTDFH